MSLINHTELKKQIQTGEFTSLNHITDDFKNILREVIQTASTTLTTLTTDIANTGSSTSLFIDAP